MADTYNENEIVKLKHLNEFARQLNVKLDGGTDPKQTRTLLHLQIQTSNSGFEDIRATKTITKSPTRIQYSSSGATLNVRFGTQDIANVVPIYHYESSIGDTILAGSLIYTTNEVNWSSRNTWTINGFIGGLSLQQPIQPQIITCTITVPATDNYEELSFTVTWNIVEEA